MNKLFYIIGFPKCGTTSLFNWLDKHPSICGSNPKETLYLMDETNPLFNRNGLNYHNDGIGKYNYFYKNCNESSICFEATTHYFYQDTARDYISSLNCNPLVVFLLREPSQRILSSFLFTKNNLSLLDEQLTFDIYVDALLSGSLPNIKSLFKYESNYHILSKELIFSEYLYWIDWWLERVDSNNINLILFEKLKNDPQDVLIDICGNIGVDASFYNDISLDQKNQTIDINYYSLHRIVKKLGGSVPACRLKYWFKDKYLSWQSRSTSPVRDYEWGLETLRRHFAPYNRLLEKRYKFDLERWWGRDSLFADCSGDDSKGV